MRIFSEANTFFHQGNDLAAQDRTRAAEHYRKAIMRFELLAKAGGNGKLFYNIGNAYFRLGDIGRAILNYRKAELYQAGDDNIRQNLFHARSLRKDLIEIKEEEKIMKTLFFWHYDLPAQARAAVAGTCYVLFWAIILVYYSKRRRGLFITGAICLLVAMVMGGSLLVDHYTKGRAAIGVVVADEVVGRKGDGLTYEPSFKDPLHSGVEFRLVENRGTWLHVELADGRRSWLPVDSSDFVNSYGFAQSAQPNLPQI